jgi:hypothetical protein
LAGSRVSPSSTVNWISWMVVRSTVVQAQFGVTHEKLCVLFSPAVGPGFELGEFAYTRSAG